MMRSFSMNTTGGRPTRANANKACLDGGEEQPSGADAESERIGRTNPLASGSCGFGCYGTSYESLRSGRSSQPAAGRASAEPGGIGLTLELADDLPRINSERINRRRPIGGLGGQIGVR